MIYSSKKKIKKNDMSCHLVHSKYWVGKGGAMLMEKFLFFFVFF